MQPLSIERLHACLHSVVRERTSGAAVLEGMGGAAKEPCCSGRATQDWAEEQTRGGAVRFLEQIRREEGDEGEMVLYSVKV
jgi:hypothetical protein